MSTNKIGQINNRVIGIIEQIIGLKKKYQFWIDSHKFMIMRFKLFVSSFFLPGISVVKLLLLLFSMAEQRLLSKGHRTTEDHVFMQINWLNLKTVYEPWTLLNFALVPVRWKHNFYFYFLGAKIEFRELRQNSVQSIDLWSIKALRLKMFKTKLCLMCATFLLFYWP